MNDLILLIFYLTKQINIASLLIAFGFYVIFQKKIVKLIFLSLFSLLLSFLIFKIFDFEKNHNCLKDKFEIYHIQ